jgi:hypothetical protein
MGEQDGDDPLRRALKGPHLLDLGGQHGAELGNQIYHASLVVLGHARIEPTRSGLELHVPALEHEDFALHPPAVGVRDRD